LDVQDDITRYIVAKIADIRGVISRISIKEVQRKGPENLDVYECVLYARDAWGSDKHLRARDCLERAVILDPNHAEAWAWLAWIYLYEYRYHFNPRPNPLDRALEAARQAVNLDPISEIAHVSLAGAE
jgi:adenylate cyclase